MTEVQTRLVLVMAGLLLGCGIARADTPVQADTVPATAAAAPPAIARTKPPVAPMKPVTEDLWDWKVTDNYRYMEALEPDTINWMKAQGTYTRSVLDSIPPRADLLRKISAFTGSFGFIQSYSKYHNRAFFEERVPGSDNFDLVVIGARGKRKIVDVAALRAAHGGKPYAINYILAAPDGSKVAVGISEGGSEDASIFVYDALTGKQLAGPMDRAEFGATSWSTDSNTLYFIRLKKLAEGESNINKYKDCALVSWDLTGEPVAILGAKVGHGPAFLPDEIPNLVISTVMPLAAAVSINGVQNEQAIWLAPAAEAAKPKTKWTPFVTRDDGVTATDASADTIYLLSHKDAPTFQVLSVDAGQPLASAEVLIPARPDRVIDSVHVASDAVYALARQGAYSILLRCEFGSRKVEEIRTPFKGHVQEAFTDPRKPGITFILESFVVPPRTFFYDPVAHAYNDLKLGVTPKYDPDRFEVKDLEAKADDGVMVPDTLIRPKGAKGAQITVIQAYGSYGISQLADFSPRAQTFREAGGSYASCHVRGGGELGEAWRLGGKDGNKFHTWHDLIACAEDLIARGLTTRQQLFIFGGSAGGITMGRAMTDRPDLFAGVIDSVPAANPLRDEFSPNGPPNIPEFGTITTRNGFHNLFEMDTIIHIKSGVQYPPVLIMTGLNDPRVSPWEPAKLTAALQATGTKRPVLLRIDAEAGHGIGSTRSQQDEQFADMWSFVFWQAGMPGWQPASNPAQ